nr:uncharacterized protein LOC129253611 [Lytechinus pictus]
MEENSHAESLRSRNVATPKLTSNDGFVIIDQPNEQEENHHINEHTSEQAKSLSISTSPTNDQRPQATGGQSPTSSSSPSLDEFCQSFEQAMTIAQHAERAKTEARTAIDRAETARNLAEQAWDQAMSASEAAQSIARSGLAVAKLSLDACNPRSKPNHQTASLKTAFDLFASQREPVMDFERFQEALSYDDEAALDIVGEFEEGEREYPCDMYNCTTCRNRQKAQSWRFFKVSPDFSSPPKDTSTSRSSGPCLNHTPKANTGIPGSTKKRGHTGRKLTGVPKCFEKYSSPLGQFSAISPRIPKTVTQRPVSEQGKVCGISLLSTNQIGEKFLQSNPGPMPARQSASDELEYLTFWPTNDSSQLEDPFYSDEGASSDDSSQSAPVFLGVRTRRAESCEEGLLNSPLKPRQLQRLSDMEPTEEIARARFHQVTAARRSQSCSSEPGADQAKRPCSPLVLPEVDSGTNVQILPNNVQVFTPPPSKSTTPPTSRHGHMTSSTKAYLSD